ncbi:shroom family member 4 isoform X1 [Amia ocellicauda]|uniref:shroom family member 4 isoform X1 n=2 Tax=Amia ocellicauda TaxID=2972642 RepID=UPI00346445D5
METIDQLVSFHHIQVQLHGGAPWGFTLKGGLEHGEPLIITKVEDGGKAALCKKLRVGDELVNINGSALYGSRQEALILIKGSYRILKMVVRRRSVPVIRPHSWHLAKLSEPPADSPAMQLHSGSFSLPWQSGGDTSELSMQWSQLSQHCSTDRSSSIGSMESLDQPNQGYYESQLSPVDQAVFNNKRDSAYSSFSASSNTSDYTVSLKADEANSMDSLLHCLGSCRHGDGRCLHGAGDAGDFPEEGKSHSLASHSDAKIRPSSYSYEEDRVTGAPRGPPQPPARRDSFKATGARPGSTDKRRASAPVDMLSIPSTWVQDSLSSVQSKVSTQVGCSCDAGGSIDSKGNAAVEQYYTLSSQLETCHDCSQETVSKETNPGSNCSGQERETLAPSPSLTNTPAVAEVEPSPHKLVSKKKHLITTHRHSAPEKLLPAQLHCLGLSNTQDRNLSPVYHLEELEIPSTVDLPPIKWAESRCSTPGSVVSSEVVEAGVESNTLDSPSPIQHTWGRSFSVPEETVSCCSQPVLAVDSAIQKEAGLASASSMDTLLEEVRENESHKPQAAPKPGSSRQHRSSKSRRRSERFATNLRNEIQRKKAQLQKSKGSSSLLYGEDVVEEVCEQPECESPCEESPPTSQVFDNLVNKTSNHNGAQNNLPTLEGPRKTVYESADPSRQGAKQDFSSSCQKIDDQAAQLKGRRWKWTPEHKLQPEERAEEKCDRAVTHKPRTTRPAPVPEDGDIPPFADRRKFFEETSKSLSTSHLACIPSRRNKPEPPGKYQAKPDHCANVFEPSRRRYSAGFVSQELSIYHTSENRGLGQQATLNNRRKNESDAEQDFCYGNRVLKPVALEPQTSFANENCRLSPNRCLQNCEHCIRPPSSAFHPVVSAAYQECPALCPAYDPRSRTPTEAHPVRDLQQTKINRKHSLTERDYQRSRYDLQPAEGDVQQGHIFQSRCSQSQQLELSPNRLSPPCVEEQPVPYPQRGRALSESDIHRDLQRLRHRGVIFGGPALSELEETAPRKKGPPPPRPPPPKWEQYKQRRASYHNLYSAPPVEPLAPHTPPSPVHKGYPRSQSPSCPRSSLEISRQRSHSLPPRGLSENCLHCCQERLVRPHSPVAAPKAFTPACYLKERNRPYCDSEPTRFTDMVPHANLHSSSRTCDSETLRKEAEMDKAAVMRSAPLSRRTAEWDRSSVPANMRSLGITVENGTRGLPESYFAMNYDQHRDLHRNLEEPSKPAQKTLPVHPFNKSPLETDIDEFKESETDEEPGEIGQKSPSQVTVLETDLDILPEGGHNSLVDVLCPDLGLKTRTDLMGELFPQTGEESGLREQWRSGRSLLELSVDTLERRSRQGSSSTQGPGSSCSAYYSTSAAKAQLLSKMKELPGMSEEEEEDELLFKKRQLIESLRKKLSVLHDAQKDLQEDIGANGALGEEVETLVQAVCKPNEVDKFRMFIGDLDKVVSLLLSLSSRLVRVESALDSLSPDASHHERLTLTEKKKLLLGQLGEAQELKEHVDRREQAVCQVLARCLTPEQLRDYSHFVKMKAALLVEQRQLEDKIRLGEEQLKGLRESLGMGYGHY